MPYSTARPLYDLAQQLASNGQARQLIVVDAPGLGAATATLTTWQDNGQGWVQAMPAMPAVDGASGWRYAADRQEGDGTTPIGIYTIGSTMFGNNADPGVAPTIPPADLWRLVG